MTTGPYPHRAIELCTRWLGHPHWPFIAGGLVILVALPSLWTGLVLDDHMHRAALMGLPGYDVDASQIFSFVSSDRAGKRRLSLRRTPRGRLDLLVCARSHGVPPPRAVRALRAAARRWFHGAPLRGIDYPCSPLVLRRRGRSYLAVMSAPAE